jgi:uncharacterized protein (DUF1015 family)
MSDLLAPPYDVIDDLEAADLRDRSPRNCVRVILPEGPPELRYEDAARTLRAWIDAGHVALDPRPSVYVYRQTFDSSAGRLERLALFCALRLTPFAEGDVLPHERTHSGPKQDRLALTLATRAQLSPIFMIARDPRLELLRLASAAVQHEPAFEAVTPDGIGHAIWVIADSEETRALCDAAGGQPLLIADGHHRYETALAASQLLSDNVKATFLLVCVVSQGDPGLSVQPTHRVLRRAPAGCGAEFEWQTALDSAFSLEALGRLETVEAEAIAARAGGGSLVALPAGATGHAWLVQPTDEALFAAGIPAERGRIAPAVFDRLVLKQLYGLDADSAAQQGLLSYVREPGACMMEAGDSGCAFILPPLSVEDVWATVRFGGRLPPKSTYFEPKVPSGLLFRSLGPGDDDG